MLRTATADDWSALTGLPVPGYWIGLAYDEGGRTLGLGGLYEGADGRWWATVLAREKRPIALHKAARQVLETADAADVDVHAVADTRIEGAEVFLARLGFARTNETIGGYAVWTRSAARS